MKDIDICKAIAHLPEELVTPEIATAGIGEGNIELLDHLPHKYLTGEAILSIINKNEKSYSWQSFSLSRIPEELRTQEVCDFAVNKDIDNFSYVPANCRTYDMLKKMVSDIDKGIKYLHLFSETLWDATFAYAGINDAYSCHVQSYRYRGGYHTSGTNDIKMVQVFLTFVPATIKTRKFYEGLFLNTKLSPEHIDLLIPVKYKRRSYYRQIATRKFSLIPEKHYCYEIFMAAMAENSQTHISTLLFDPIKSRMLACMDDTMADRVVTVSAGNFKDLPKNFQTSKRLILAIDSFTGSYGYSLVDDSYRHLFTKSVCQAFIRKDRHYPEFPKHIWTSGFVDYCLQHGPSFNWFEQMPKHLQTPGIVYKALEENAGYLAYARPELISLEQAQKLFRQSEYTHQYIPERFYTDFIEQTGLPKEFFGGETDFHSFRENRTKHTYCKLGHCYLGFYQYERYGSPTRLIMTRRTPHSIRPETVFDRTIGTYHSTWLEKLIADYDPCFIKPSITKGLKQYQINGYYTVEKVETYKAHTICVNTLLGERISYSVKINGRVEFFNQINNLKEEIDETEQQKTIVPHSQHPDLQRAAV